MMFSAVCVLVASASVAPQKSAGQLVSAVFKHYYDASSLAGHFRLTQSAQGHQVVIETNVAYDRPSKLNIAQLRQDTGKRWRAVSDGRIFWYDRPANVYGKDRFSEPVAQIGRSETLADMYSGAARSLGDRSPILDMAIAAPEDLKSLRAHWNNLRLGGEVTLRGQKALVVKGDYFAIVGADPTGTFELDTTEDGDVLRYIQIAKYAIKVEGQAQAAPIEVTSVWEADLKIGAINDPKVYAGGMSN